LYVYSHINQLKHKIMTTQKLITLYSTKIVELEEKIKLAYKTIGDFRNGKSSVIFIDQEEAIIKAQIAMTRKQDYTQFIKDLEDL
jgi:hypothetical protein